VWSKDESVKDNEEGKPCLLLIGEVAKLDNTKVEEGYGCASK
jgi:hypothetical protein